jgi:two-component system, response regulator
MGKPKVLVVDSDADDIKLIEEAFRTLGPDINCSFFNDGDKLIDFLGENHAELPDLILMDLKLPKRPGWEIVNEIRSNPALIGIPILILSTLGQNKDLFQGLNVQGFINKPSSFAELSGLLSAIKAFLK